MPDDNIAAACTYRGRVRTGCLTCRKRKVKCDEQRPCCRNCTASKTPRSYVYPPRKTRGSSAAVIEAACSLGNVSTSAEPCVLATESTGTPTISEEPSPGLQSQRLGFIDDGLSPSTSQGPQPAPETEQSPYSFNAPVFPESTGPSTLSLMTSQDISICTTIDFLSACRVSDAPSLSGFVENVSPPVIAAYDPVNWHRIKALCVDLALRDKTVCSAVVAVQALYSAQAAGLTTSYALALYRSASDKLHETLTATRREDHCDFDTILMTVFLLSLCEILVPEETQSILSLSEGPFLDKLESQVSSGAVFNSPVANRIIVWLKLIQPTTRRGGNPGLLSHEVKYLLSKMSANYLPSLSFLDVDTVSSTNLLFDAMSTAVFSFYRELQDISCEVASLSHYHRSRTTGQDQEEVDQLIAQLKSRLYVLWQCRPGPMRLDPAAMRQQLTPAVAEPLVELVGITAAAYHAEIVEVGRTLSEPPLASEEAKRAMRNIRSIVEDKAWNAYGYDSSVNSSSSSGSKTKLHPGYLRPLFMCAIESINENDTLWAVERIRQIRDSICRSEFFARFAESLAAAQRRKGRRVTTKWFCCEVFGVSPPYL